MTRLLLALCWLALGASAFAANCTSYTNGCDPAAAIHTDARTGIATIDPCYCPYETPSNANYQRLIDKGCVVISGVLTCGEALPPLATAVGPGCVAGGACLTDGVATTVAATDLLVWEGSTVDTNEFRVTVPTNPAVDYAWTQPTCGSTCTTTFPAATATLATTALTETLTNKTLTAPTIGGASTISDGATFAGGTSTGTKIGTGTTQKFGFFNATPIAQPASTSDLRAALINLGFVATGGATPLDLNGGAFTTTGTATIGTSGAAITRTLTGSATLDFASAVVTACSADLTITVTNAADGDPVILGTPNGSVSAGSIFSAWVSAAGTVTVRHCCAAGTACDPASGTFKARVIQ